MAAVFHRFAVELQDYVAVLQPGFVRGSFRNDVAHNRALVVLQLELSRQRGRDVLNHYAEVTTRDLAVLDQTFHHVASKVGRDREADALIAPAAAEDRSVDADEPTLGIDQPPA